MNTEELLDKLDKAYHKAVPVTFSTVEDALKVAGSALKWLTDQCEDKEDGSNTKTESDTSADQSGT